MANTKVSAFTAASALGGTETVGGVQGGANRKITIDQIKTYCRSRAEVWTPAITTSAATSCLQSNHIVRTAAGIWYLFYIDAGTSDVYYVKSSNYGVSWAVPVLVHTGTGAGLAVWFDKWTPADSGTAIHLAYTDSGSHDVFYRRLDTSGDSLGTALTVFDGASLVAGNDSCLSITKAVGGLIHIAFDIDGGTEVGHYKSDAATPTSFASADTVGAFHEAVSTDYYMLFPANLVTTEDIWAVFWDRSANEITIKTFDDSLSSWATIAESSAITGMTDVTSGTASPQFAGAIRNTDGHLMLVAWTNADTASATLRFWDVTDGATIAAPITIVTSTDDQAMCGINVDTDANALTVFYAGKTDGSETFASALNVYLKQSTDNGATWGSETQVSLAARAIANLMCSLESTSGEYAIAWFGNVAAGGPAREYVVSAYK